MLRGDEASGGGDEGEECGVGGPEMTRAETRTEEIGSDSGASEELVGLQETDGMVIEYLSREMDEGMSVETTGLRLTGESTKEGRSQGVS